MLIGGVNLSGPGNLIFNSGSLKFNVGFNQPSIIGGAGSITMNGTSTLAIVKNSGTMNFTRAIVMNGTSTLSPRNSTVDVASPIAFNGTHTLDPGGNTNLTGAWTGSGTVNRSGGGTLSLTGSLAGFTGSLNLTAGTTNLADDAGMSFVVTDASSTQIGGTGTVMLNGDFTIDTSAVTLDSGSWVLVNKATLADTQFGAGFSVAGWSESTPGVWTKSENGMDWAFSESSGELILGAVGYDGWIAGFDFTAFPGADLSPDGDADGDGIPNAVEFVIGTLPNESKVEHLPTIALVTDPADLPAGEYLRFSYRRTTASVDAEVGSGAQYDTTLAGPWTDAVDGVSGVAIVETPNGAIPGDDIDVYIPQSLADGGKLFGRLSVTVP
jgi:hypothetical protein